MRTKEHTRQIGVSDDGANICVLHKFGLYGGMARRKPMWTESYVKSCLQFASKHVDGQMRTKTNFLTHPKCLEHIISNMDRNMVLGAMLRGYFFFFIETGKPFQS
ncbi:hypothetical protein ATANTOWER_004412 [Ataeniobius toweri]|uniref:LAGLIDADG homing endonuclease n=1 Tax=Ataeniobius toweri TaxID=208326 RepID=A0ABU7C688_9TELE|nr:hypothetical protein [Ataeniobius toweri]